MREVRQLQTELEEPTPTPSVAPSGDSTPLEWDTKALPQYDEIVSDAQPNHTMETPQTTELSHRVLESIENHKLQVTMRDMFSLSPSLTEFVRSRLTEVVASPSRTPTTEEPIAAIEAIDKHMLVISICIGKNVVDDVLLDRGSGVNVITEEECMSRYSYSVPHVLEEYRDVFEFSYEDLWGISEHIATHRIELDTAISPSHQARYRMNPNYAKAIKEDLEKLLKADFIELVDQATWLSPIVVVPKKNGKLRICVDFRRLNAATKKDPYPLPFTNEVLDTVIGYVAYSFIDCFLGYHQVHIHENDRYKTAFIIEWGAYVWVVMPFGLKNAPPT